jgi:hypothetical protein
LDRREVYLVEYDDRFVQALVFVVSGGGTKRPDLLGQGVREQGQIVGSESGYRPSRVIRDSHVEMDEPLALDRGWRNREFGLGASQTRVRLSVSSIRNCQTGSAKTKNREEIPSPIHHCTSIEL